MAKSFLGHLEFFSGSSQLQIEGRTFGGKPDALVTMWSGVSHCPLFNRPTVSSIDQT